MKIGVIFGSPSVEHLGSCVSGTHVANVLSSKYKVKRILIGMNGKWTTTEKRFTYSNPSLNRKFYDEANKIGIPRWEKPNLLKVAKILKGLDVVIPLTHGPYGESGMLQGFLEILGIPYTGPGVETCVLTQNKDLIKILCKQKNIPVSSFIPFDNNEWIISPKAFLQEIFKKLSFPLFVKPNDGGSSIGLSKVIREKDLKKAIKKAFRFSTRVIVEEGISGYEIECAIIGNNNLTVPKYVGEIIPSNEFYDLEAKYFKPSDLAIPARHISSETTDRIKKLSKIIYKIARSSGFSRIDFLVDKKTKTPYLNEFTALPGCTEYSLFPQLFVKSGWKEVTLWEKIINLALEKHNNNI